MTIPALQHSLDDIARDYGKMVSSICRRMIMDEETARDAAQQVWVEITKSHSSFRGESKMSTWIYTITRRIAFDHVQREQKFSARHLLDYARGEEMEPPGMVDLDKQLWVREMCNKCLSAALHCFDTEARLAMILKDIADCSYEEIASIVEKEEPAVRQMVSRNRRKLQFFMNGLCTLYNPEGNCRCRMKKWVKEIDLNREYEKIRRIVGKVSFFKQAELVLPRKNYWESLL
jgi:RNA polymerase sigma-70 factor (ECF subfamily)